MPELVLSVSDFVAVCNQTLEYAYASVVIVGEIANLRISKNRWLYFDLKDEYALVKFFGNVTQLPGPVEDGMVLQVRGVPRLHPLYGFSVNIQLMSLVGEGTIKKSAAMLEARLRAEGLFDENRKRALPSVPQRIGLVTSSESAAYHDFIKILNDRWRGVSVEVFDVQVQGEAAPKQIIAAIEYFNNSESPVDVIVVTRGGGSAEDLVAFNDENVVRAVAASRAPTLVAIGHEIDVSLAELVADRRASTPTNAAQVLVPDRLQAIQDIAHTQQQLADMLTQTILQAKHFIEHSQQLLNSGIDQHITKQKQVHEQYQQLIKALDPRAILRRGYAVVRAANGKALHSVKQLKTEQPLSIQLADGVLTAKVKDITVQ